MNNLEIIEKITKGTTATEQITLSNGEEITIRPLTAGELAELQRLEKKVFKMKVGVDQKGKKRNVETTNTDVNIDAGEFSKSQTDTLFTAVAYGLSINDNKISKKQVEAFPVGIPEQIFTELVRISNISNNDLKIIKNFR